MKIKLNLRFFTIFIVIITIIISGVFLFIKMSSSNAEKLSINQLASKLNIESNELIDRFSKIGININDKNTTFGKIARECNMTPEDLLCKIKDLEKLEENFEIKDLENELDTNCLPNGSDLLDEISQCTVDNL
ncbi:MAG: translation initiation factor IF-2 N-terminal domain-containing protein [Pseudomonadota bacterium]